MCVVCGVCCMIVGIVGYIDYGKIMFVCVLMGVDIDWLKEEKVCGILIELGYVYMLFDNGDVFGLIDVLGYEKLIYMMVVGVCGIDFVLFVIVVDDGVMLQMCEYFVIL